jgi:class 3 adenylate cyclase
MTAEPPGASSQTFFVADVVGYGDRRRTNRDHLAIRNGFFDILQVAFQRAGIEWAQCHIEDRGDGLLTMAPVDIPKRLFTRALPRTLVDALKEYNLTHANAWQIRLRVALHTGEVYRDAHGIVGVDLNLVFRLLDSAELRRTFAESHGDLAIVVSERFFSTIVRHDPESRPEIYRRVRVKAKETVADAWVCLPDSPLPPHVPASVRGRTCNFFISYAHADRLWAEWIAWQLRELGYVVELDSGQVPAGRNFARWISDSLDRADFLLIVVSPEFIRSTWTMSETQSVFHTAPGAVLPVIVRPTAPTFLDTLRGLDLIGVGEETARQRLLAALPQGELTPRSAPAYPGAAAPQGKPHFPDGPTPVAADPLNVLVVHALDDHEAALELADSLRTLETEGMLAPVELRPVSRLDEETEQYVDERVRRSDIVLLLVSRELVTTGYGASAELRLLVRRNEQQEMTALLVILRPTSWEQQPFGRLTALPSDGVPVSQWTSRDEAIKNIVEGVRLIARGLPNEETPSRPARRQLPVLELGAIFKQTGMPTLVG